MARLHQHSTEIIGEKNETLAILLSDDQAWRLPIQLDAVDPKYLQFLISYEDRRFYAHVGVDSLAAARAILQVVRHGQVVSGASTLTMQLARLLEPRPRNVVGKLIQAYRAIQIERRASKREILEAYLTLAPFGGNIEGVRAASLAYFGKEPARLTEAEAALLVAIPRLPEAMRPDRRPGAARIARNKVLRIMGERGLISPEALTTALEEPIPVQRHAFPNIAPHLAKRVVDEGPGLGVQRTTIAAELQQAVLRVAARHVRGLEPQANIAILVVENEGRKVRAYLGSTDHLAVARSGANDMVRAVRSPGSTLKPFIYSMGFEDLAVHPETLMPDVAMRFGDYAPKNFDDYYRGEITAREALQASLNLPAVALLDRIGPRRFVRRLADAGVELRLPKGAVPGLPMALGGVGINLEGLVSLYSALADGGVSRPLDFGGRRSGAVHQELAMITSPLGAYYTTRILLDSPPPPTRLASGNRQRASQIAFKTGTSYGFRDAWAIGYDRNFTVGVWVGRPDGSYSPGRIGRDAAAPILFEVFDLLPSSPAALPTEPPAGAIITGNSELPLNLRRFLVLGQGTVASQERGPRIVYPVDGADIELQTEDGAWPDLVLEADGGELPLRWLVNGRPVETMPFRRRAEWPPNGAGAARITVIDRAGRSASSNVWLQ